MSRDGSSSFKDIPHHPSVDHRGTGKECQVKRRTCSGFITKLSTTCSRRHWSQHPLTRTAQFSGDPASFRFEMTHANRFSVFPYQVIQLSFYNPPNSFVDTLLDLAIRMNATPPRTPITVVWNQDLPHYDSTCGDNTRECGPGR